MKSTWKIGMLCLAVLLVFAACANNDDGSDTAGNNNEAAGNVGNNNGNDENSNDVTEEREDVTLRIMMAGAVSDFEDYWIPLIESELPHITVEYMEGNFRHHDVVQEHVTANEIPDIFFASEAMAALHLDEFQLGLDMRDLFEQNNFDLSRFDDAHLQSWSSWSGGELWILPFMMDRFALHYNKDVFDTFGVSYPEDGMTWDEVIDLASDVTGEIDGVQYRGLHVNDALAMAIGQVMGDTQYIDAETHEVLWTENEYVAEFLEKVEIVDRIPGNEFPEVPDEVSPYGPFQEGTLAMLPRWFLTPDELNWDVVTFPQWEDAPGIGPVAEGWGLGITSTSEHQQEAFEVLELLFSDEHIMDLAETPIHAPYAHLHEDGTSMDYLDPEVHANFYDKNLDALVALEGPGAPDVLSRLQLGAFGEIDPLAYNYLESEMDIGSFLREVREREEIRVQEELAQN